MTSPRRGPAIAIAQARPLPPTTPSLRAPSIVPDAGDLGGLGFYDYAVRGLKIAACLLAGATVALAIVNQQQANRAIPVIEPATTETTAPRNETVVYRQAPKAVSAERADQAVVEYNQQDDESPSYFQRIIHTISFFAPRTQDDKFAAAPEPRPLIKVGGFVAFPAKETAEPDTAADSVMRGPPPGKRGGSIMDEVDKYLWEVYLRVPVKKDGSGDFTWKDPAAAKRMNISLQDYVIGGMDPEFREQLYHAGKAMDAAGLEWSLLSAFRDDYRQKLASGFKASVGNSLHGGSRRTGGYGHGRAIDITGTDGSMHDVWQWIDAHGAKYGLYRPMPGNDPAHIQQRGDWQKIAINLREARIHVADAGKGIGKDKSKYANAR
jgi:hypothetical protein